MDPFKSSRFRFLDSQPFNFECKYTDIVLPSSNVDQVIVKTNGELFALPINGPTGQLYVRPVRGSERFTHKVPRLNCHRYAVSAFSFDPFDTSYLMTGAEDGEIRLWKVPKEGILKNENDPILSLEGHRRKILNMEYNPVASGILATGSRHFSLYMITSSDGSCKVWDISAKKELMSMELQGSQLQEMKWDYTGSLLCTGTKNREYQIWDPRTVNVVTSWMGHASPRRSYMTWLGDSYYLVTTGYSKQSNREVCLRDIRNVDKVLYTITADNSPGPFVPFYNPCCHILWYSGRGDAKLNGIDVDDVTMWTNREGGNCININMKSSVKSLAMLPQHSIDIKRNEVDKFLRINMDSGVDGFDVILPHQAGAAITEIYGRLPIPSPSVTHDGWLKGAIEKPKTKEVTTETPLKKGLSSGRRQSEENQMKFMKPADMKAFIMQSRSSSFSQEELNSFNRDLASLADTLKSQGSTFNTVKSTDSNTSFTRSLNVSTIRRSTVTGRGDGGSVASVKTSDGMSRRISMYRAPEKSQTTLRKGNAVRAQLEQSKNRLCLNLNRQKKDPLPPIKETTSSTHSSRGYRVSDITNKEHTSTPSPAVTIGELKKSQPTVPSLSSSNRPSTISLSPSPSSHSTPINNVTPVSSRGPSLISDNVHLRVGVPRPSGVFQETRNSWNRTINEQDKELLKIQSRLEAVESALSRYDEINKKLDKVITLLEERKCSDNSEILESVNRIRQRLGCLSV